MHGIDLAELWATGRWRKLLNLIDRLPHSSHYREAQLDDPDVAEHLAAMPPGPPGAPRLSGFTYTDSLLATLIDRLGILVQVAFATAGQKAPTLPPAARPVTGLDRARSRRMRQRHDELVARVLHPSRRKG